MRRLRLLIAVLLALVVVARPGSTVSAFSGLTSNPSSSFTAASGFCKNPSAPIMTTGWESASPDGIFSGSNGATTADSTTARTGDWSLKITQTSGSSSYVRENVATQVLVARFAIRFAMLPAASVRIVDTNGSGTLPTVGYDQPSGKLKVAIGATGQLSASTISVGIWYRLDLRFDHSATTRKVDWQLDGVAQTQVSKTGESITNVTQIYLGSDVSTDTYTAWFDDLTLTATSADYPLGDSRVFGLRPDGVTAVNDPAGSKVKDDGGTNVAVATPGISSKLADNPMTVTSSYVTLGDTDRFSATAPFSVEVWVNPTAATAGEREIVNKEDSGGVGWALILSPTTNVVSVERGSGGTWDSAFSTTQLKAGTWYHVVGTYDGTSLRTYVNGTLEATTASSRSLPTITDPLGIGAGVSCACSNYGGVVDEVAVYPTALSQASIQAHYNAGKL